MKSRSSSLGNSNGSLSIRRLHHTGQTLLQTLQKLTIRWAGMGNMVGNECAHGTMRLELEQQALCTDHNVMDLSRLWCKCGTGEVSVGQCPRLTQVDRTQVPVSAIERTCPGPAFSATAAKAPTITPCGIPQFGGDWMASRITENEQVWTI